MSDPNELNSQLAVAHARLLRWMDAICEADSTASMGLATPSELMSQAMTWMMLGGLATKRGCTLMHKAMGGSQQQMQTACFEVGSRTDSTDFDGGEGKKKPPRRRPPQDMHE